MDIVTVSGGLGLALAVAAPVAQLLRLLKRSDANGLSISALFLTTFSSGLWSVYGIIHQSNWLAATYGAIFVIVAVTLFSSHRMVGARMPLSTLAILCTAFCLSVAVPLVGVFLLAGITVVRPALQVGQAIKSPSVSGISPTSWTIAALCSATWAMHAGLTHDTYLLLTSAWCGTAAAVLAVLTITFQRNASTSPGPLDATPV